MRVTRLQLRLTVVLLAATFAGVAGCGVGLLAAQANSLDYLVSAATGACVAFGVAGAIFLLTATCNLEAGQRWSDIVLDTRSPDDKPPRHPMMD